MLPAAYPTLHSIPIPQEALDPSQLHSLSAAGVLLKGNKKDERKILDAGHSSMKLRVGFATRKFLFFLVFLFLLHSW